MNKKPTFDLRERINSTLSFNSAPAVQMQEGGKIKTFSNDPEYFNSQTFDKWTIKQLRTGKYGVDPESGALYKLKKPVKVPQEFLDLTSENPSDTETARRARVLADWQTIYRNPTWYLPGMIGLGAGAGAALRAAAPGAMQLLNAPMQIGSKVFPAVTPANLLTASQLAAVPQNVASGVSNIGQGNYAQGAADLGTAVLDVYVPEALNVAKPLTTAGQIANKYRKAAPYLIKNTTSDIKSFIKTPTKKDFKNKLERLKKIQDIFGSTDEGRKAFNSVKSKSFEFWNTPEGERRIKKYIDDLDLAKQGVTIDDFKDAMSKIEYIDRGSQKNIEQKFISLIKDRNDTQPEIFSLVQKEDELLKKLGDGMKAWETARAEGKAFNAQKYVFNVKDQLVSVRDDLSKVRSRLESLIDETAKLPSIRQDNASYFPLEQKIYIGGSYSNPMDAVPIAFHEWGHGKSGSLLYNLYNKGDKNLKEAVRQPLFAKEERPLNYRLKEKFNQLGTSFDNMSVLPNILLKSQPHLMNPTPKNISKNFRNLKNPVSNEAINRFLSPTSSVEDAYRYFKTGDEPSGFIGEVLGNLIENNFIKSQSEKIDVDMLKNAIKNYRENPNIKTPVRFFDFINPTDKSLKDLADELNDLTSQYDKQQSSDNQLILSAQQGGTVNRLQQMMGYKDNSPYKNLPYQDIYSDRITMSGVSRPLVATTDTGVRTVMQPGGEYYFPGATQVRETPLYSNGGGDKYTTKLTSKEEKEFKAWYNKVASYKGLNPNPDSPDQYYDYRGFWKNEDRDKILTDNAEVHFFDTYKKPGHPTFSNQSKYSTDKTPGGSWSLSEDGTYYFTHSPYTEKYSDRTTDYLRGSGEHSILKGDTIYSTPKLIPNKMRNGGELKDRENLQTMKLNTYTTPLSKLTGISTPKFQNSGNTSSNNQVDENDAWIRQILEFEAKSGSATGKGLSNWGYNNWKKFGHPRPPRNIEEAIEYFKKDFLPKVAGYPLEIRKRLGDYAYNSGRSIEDLLLLAAGKISLDDINSSKVFTEDWNKYKDEIQKSLNDPAFAKKLDSARHDVAKTTKGYTLENPNPAYDASWSKRIDMWTPQDTKTEQKTQQSTQPNNNTQNAPVDQRDQSKSSRAKVTITTGASTTPLVSAQGLKPGTYVIVKDQVSGKEIKARVSGSFLSGIYDPVIGGAINKPVADALGIATGTADLEFIPIVDNTVSSSSADSNTSTAPVNTGGANPPATTAPAADQKDGGDYINVQSKDRAWDYRYNTQTNQWETKKKNSQDWIKLDDATKRKVTAREAIEDIYGQDLQAELDKRKKAGAATGTGTTTGTAGVETEGPTTDVTNADGTTTTNVAPPAVARPATTTTTQAQNYPPINTAWDGKIKSSMQRNIDKFLEERATAEKSKANIQEIQRKRQALEQLGLPPEFTNTDNTTPTQSRPTSQIPALPNRSMLAITPQNRRQISAPPLNMPIRSSTPQTTEETQPQTTQEYQPPTLNVLNPYQYENPRENVSLHQTSDGINVVRDNQGRVFLEKEGKAVPLSSNTEGRLGESNEEILNQISSDPAKLDSFLKDTYNKGLTNYYKPSGEVYREVNYPSLNRDVYGYPEIGSEEHNKMIDEYNKSINEFAKKYGATAVKKEDRGKIDTSSLPKPPSSNTSRPPYVNGGQVFYARQGGQVVSGALSGIKLGSMFGPIGAGLGAIVGGIGGVMAEKSQDRAAREQRNAELLAQSGNTRQSGLANLLGSNNQLTNLLTGPNLQNMPQRSPAPYNAQFFPLTPRMSQLMPPPFQEGAQVQAPIYTNETPPQVYSTGLNREQLQTPAVKPTLLDMKPLKKEKDAESSQSAAETQAGTGQRIITIKDEDGTPKRVLVDSAGNVIRFIDQPMSEQEKLDLSYSQGIDYATSARNFVEQERQRRAQAAQGNIDYFLSYDPEITLDGQKRKLSSLNWEETKRWKESQMPDYETKGQWLRPRGTVELPVRQQQGGPIITSLLYRNMDKNNSIKNNISMNKSKLENVINLSNKVNPYRLSPMGVYKNGGLIMEGGVSASRAGFSRQPITGASSTGPLGPKRSEVPSYTNKGVNSIMDLPTNEYVPTENMIPIQAEIGEMIVLPTGDLMPVMARRRHHQMQDDEVTDMTPENSYILSAHGQVRINKDEANLLITETGVKPYRLGQSQNPPTEKTLGSVMTKKVMRPAEVAKRINSLFPVLSTDNPFEIAANIENKINRKPYLEGLIQLSELDKYRKGLSEPAMSDLEQQQMQMPQRMPGSPMLARQGRRISRPGVVKAQDSRYIGSGGLPWGYLPDEMGNYPGFEGSLADPYSTAYDPYTGQVVTPRTNPPIYTNLNPNMTYGSNYIDLWNPNMASPANQQFAQDQNQNGIFSALSAPANFAARLIGSQAIRGAERAGIARERGIYDQGFGRIGNLMTAGTAAEAAMLGAQDPFVKWRDIPDTYIRSMRTQTPGQVVEAQSAAAFANLPDYSEMGQAGLAAQNAAYARGLEQSSRAMMDAAERDRAAFNTQQALLQENLAGNVAGRLAAERATTAAINKMLSGYGSLANRYAQGQIDLTGQRMGANIGLSRAEQASKTGLYQNRLNAFTTFTGDMTAGGEAALKALLGFGG